MNPWSAPSRSWMRRGDFRTTPGVAPAHNRLQRQLQSAVRRGRAAAWGAGRRSGGGAERRPPARNSLQQLHSMEEGGEGPGAGPVPAAVRQRARAREVGGTLRAREAGACRCVPCGVEP